MIARFFFHFIFLLLVASCSAKHPELKNGEIVKPSESVFGDTVHTVNGEIRCIFQDSKNHIWFASNGDGVYKYDGTTIFHISEKQGLCSNYVWYIDEGKDGTIWFKTREA